jgi:predicted enzyme related to lactoylglutathione lyase
VNLFPTTFFISNGWKCFDYFYSNDLKATQSKIEDADGKIIVHANR